MRVEERRWHITLLLAVWTLIGHLPLTVSGAIREYQFHFILGDRFRMESYRKHFKGANTYA